MRILAVVGAGWLLAGVVVGSWVGRLLRRSAAGLEEPPRG